MPLKCLNPQLPDPKHRKQSKNSPDVLLSYCAYHNPFCFGDHNGDGQVTIKFPNKDTFCTDCYLAKHKRQPGKLPPGRIPGVVNAQTGKPMGGAPVAEDEEMGVDEELPVCGWKPDKIEALTEMRGYVCKNRCYRDPTSKMLMSTCAMHIRKCVKMHSGDDGKIDIRNIFGLCMMHHIAEHGEPPIEVPLPYPGMERRLRSKGWKIKPGHFFAPTWPRKEDIIYKKQYIAPPKPTNFIEQIRLQAKQNEYKRLEFVLCAKMHLLSEFEYFRRVKLLGKLAATIIQTYFRRYRLLGCHRNLIFAANARRRTDSALIIQCFGRRYNGRKVFLARLKRDADAAVFIQRAYRGTF